MEPGPLVFCTLIILINGNSDAKMADQNIWYAPPKGSPNSPISGWKVQNNFQKANPEFEMKFGPELGGEPVHELRVPFDQQFGNPWEKALNFKTWPEYPGNVHPDFKENYPISK